MSPIVIALVVGLVVIGPIIICLRRPLDITLPLYAALIPYGPLIALKHSPKGNDASMWTRFGTLSSLVGVLLVVGLLLALIAGRKVSVPMSPTIPLWLLMVGLAGATTLWSLDPVHSVNGFLSLGSLAAVYILISLTNVDRRILTRTENGLLLGGVTVCLYGLAQFFLLGGFPDDVTGRPTESGGRFGNDMLGPNNEAIALLLPLFVAVSRSLTRQEARTRNLYSAIAALMLLGIVMTGSRGGILAAIAGALVMTITSKQGRPRLLIYISAGMAFGAIAFFLHPLGLAQRDVATDSSSGRTDIWRVGAAACPKYCPLGAGWEAFPLVYAETQPTVPDAAVLVGKGGSYQPHNVILLVAIELGLPGLILLFAVLGVTLVEAFRLPRSLRGPPLAALAGTYFSAMFLSNLEFKFFWMALIMVAMSRSLSIVEDPTGVDGTSRQRELLLPAGPAGRN